MSVCLQQHRYQPIQGDVDRRIGPWQLEHIKVLEERLDRGYKFIAQHVGEVKTFENGEDFLVITMWWEEP